MKRISAVDRPDGSCPAMAVPVAKRPKLDVLPTKSEPMLPTAVEPSKKGLPPSAVKFMAKAAIENFDRQHVQLPMRHRSYNDDVEVEAYGSPVLAYAGKQRRGIHENLESRASMLEHVSRALREPFPLSVGTPMPKDTSDAAIVSRDCPPDQLRSFWASHQCKLEKMVLDSESAQQKWDKAIPDGIKLAAGNLKTVALSQLMRQCGLKGEKRIRQFPNGFQITGELSRKSAYELSKKYQTVIPLSCLYETAFARFKERAAKSGHANAQVMRGEALAKVGKGWLTPPVPLDASGKLDG